MANDRVIPRNETPQGLTRAEAVAAATGIDSARYAVHVNASAGPGLPASQLAALIESFSDSAIRGLVNHSREAAPADLAAWRQAWPGEFGGLDDDQASGLVRFIQAMAGDPDVMAEHFGNAPRNNRRNNSDDGTPYPSAARGPGDPVGQAVIEP